MKNQNAIKSEFQKLGINRKIDFCHSMDIDNYKILCKDFFSKKSNKDLWIFLAEQSTMLGYESEEEFLHWINAE